MRTLSQILVQLKEALTAERICLSDIIEHFHERGIGFLLFIFALPAALPLPGLGVNLIIAAPLLILTAQQAVGRHSVWIPETMKRKSVSRARFVGMIDAALPSVGKIEKLVKPRLSFITHGLFSKLIGVCGLIMALSICVPLPLTNTVPAMGIALMSIGVVMRDGVAVIVGAMLGLAWVFILVFIIGFLGMEGLDIMKETIKSLL